MESLFFVNIEFSLFMLRVNIKQKCWRKVLTTLLINSVILLFCSGATLPIQELDQIVLKSKENRDSIQSLKIIYTLESTLRHFSPGELQRTVQCMWYWDKNRERLKLDYLTYLIDSESKEQLKQDNLTYLTDSFFDGKKFYFQKLFADTRPLSPCYQGESSGYYHVQNEPSFHHDSPDMFCNVFFPGRTQLYSLENIIKNWTIVSCEMIDDDNGLIKICADYPPNGSIPELRGNAVQITIDTQKSCSIQNVLCFDKNIAKDMDGNYVTTVIQFSVSDYHHEDDIFFPKKGRILFFGPVESFEKNEPFHEIDYTASDITVNKYEADTGFAFSPNLIVFENKSHSISDIIRIHLWGENNKPVKTFRDLNQLQKYVENTCDPSRSPHKDNNFFMYRVIMGFTGFLLILLVVYLKTRKRRQ
jgi:hypothetical protein